MCDTILTEAVKATWVVAISPDGKWWAASTMQGKVRIWEEESQMLHSYPLFITLFIRGRLQTRDFAVRQYNQVSVKIQ